MKQGFIEQIASQHGCTKKEAEKVIDMFTYSVIEAMREGKEINLIGFGSFSIMQIAARNGINPRTRESINIQAYNKPRFKAGEKLKKACNELG
jgi:DNA-binding protein HU-beta